MASKQPEALHCAVSGEPLAAQSAIWLVRHPETGAWLVDISGKLPGESVPVRCDMATLYQALQERGVQTRAVGEQIDRVARQLRKEALNWLPLALKSGSLIIGFDSVNKALRGGGLAMLLHAADASDDGLRKVAGIAKGQGLPPVVRDFSQTELAAALGRAGNVVHLGLTRGGVQQSFLRSCQRLGGFSPQHTL